MKKILILSSLLLTSTVITTTPAIADSSICDETNPCHTYAVVDVTGLVINTIVCQPSVCGSGELGGNRVVLQIEANPITHENQGGVFSTEPGKEVRYDDTKNYFTQGSVTNPINSMKTETDNECLLTTKVNSTKVSFGPNNYTNGVMVFDPVSDSSTSAFLSITGCGEQSKTFENQQTRAQIEQATRSFDLIYSRLNRFLGMLRGWVLD
jgi:hypothetical protein